MRVLVAVSAGGVIGACARYGIGTMWPHPVGRFPWAMFTINVTGCLLIGMLMVAVTEIWPDSTLLRPFLGTGVLGGFTTFSTYAVDAAHLLDTGATTTAFAYLVTTVLAALLAAYIGIAVMRAAISRTTGEAKP